MHEHVRRQDFYQTMNATKCLEHLGKGDTPERAKFKAKREKIVSVIRECGDALIFRRGELETEQAARLFSRFDFPISDSW